MVIGDRTWTHNYAEMGFVDGRTGKANSAWVALRELARKSGTLVGFVGPEKVKKQMQEIRRILREHVEREHFEISGDPLPYVSGSGYQAAFKIDCGPSFDS